MDGGCLEVSRDLTSEHFIASPVGISSKEDMISVLNFEHRLRLTAFVKELFSLPCMSPAGRRSESHGEVGSGTLPLVLRRAAGFLHELDRADQALLMTLQAERLTVSRKEEDPDVEDSAVSTRIAAEQSCELARFTGGVFESPSAYIRALVRDLPREQRLTKEQTLFVVSFAKACDEVWRDEIENKPWAMRKVHHFLLLGQGGSGKTHVVQKIVFEVVGYIWPSFGEGNQTLLVVAMSNAQAKNISTTKVKARTAHIASAMRIQQLINSKMRLGNKQKVLTSILLSGMLYVFWLLKR